jgi:hypothetical protein
MWTKNELNTIAWVIEGKSDSRGQSRSPTQFSRNPYQDTVNLLADHIKAKFDNMGEKTEAEGATIENQRKIVVLDRRESDSRPFEKKISMVFDLAVSSKEG